MKLDRILYRKKRMVKNCDAVLCYHKLGKFLFNMYLFILIKPVSYFQKNFATTCSNFIWYTKSFSGSVCTHSGYSSKYRYISLNTVSLCKISPYHGVFFIRERFHYFTENVSITWPVMHVFLSCYMYYLNVLGKTNPLN